MYSEWFGGFLDPDVGAPLRREREGGRKGKFKSNNRILI